MTSYLSQKVFNNRRELLLLRISFRLLCLELFHRAVKLISKSLRLQGSRDTAGDQHNV